MAHQTMLQKGTALLLSFSLLTVSAFAEVDNPNSAPSETTDLWQSAEEVLAPVFPDVPQGASYAQAVSVLAELEVIKGDDKGNFNPDATVTRGEMAAILCRLLEEEKSGRDTGFLDVSTSHWAAGYVAKTVELGIINGYGDGNFGPENPVTCEQVVKMLVCAWGYEEDAQQEGGWPTGYWKTAQSLGLLQGVALGQEEPAARATTAILCYNTLNTVRGNPFQTE